LLNYTFINDQFESRLFTTVAAYMQAAMNNLHLSGSSRESRHELATILLVEDETFVRKVACEILMSGGYRVLEAKDAAEAVETFRAEPEAVQLILADVVLPDRNGCDLAFELAPRKDIRVIFISGYPVNRITRNGLEQPGWFYLPKPFSAESLLGKVKEALSEM
jgi:two-component system, cell cycle sensor histidine kinase and response regulator CckA